MRRTLLKELITKQAQRVPVEKPSYRDSMNEQDQNSARAILYISTIVIAVFGGHDGRLHAA
jgi:hypothetical protein